MPNYCGKCKRSKDQVDGLLKNSSYYTSTGEKKWSKYCRRCNRERANNYYHNGGKKNIIKARDRYEKRNPERREAWKKVNHAKNTGELKEPNICDDCKEDKELVAHHEDYSKPLDVQWLCHSCHAKAHA